MIVKRIGFVLPVFLVLFLLPGGVNAHKVYVFAYAEDGTVYTESGFSGNTPVTDGTIKVEDQKGNVLLKGEPDEEGKFSFPVPKGLETDIVITLEAGSGHKGTWTLEYSEIQEGAKGKSGKEKYAQRKKEKVKSPGVVKVVSGIVLIFLSFFALSYVRKKRGRTKDN